MDANSELLKSTDSIPQQDDADPEVNLMTPGQVDGPEERKVVQVETTSVVLEAIENNQTQIKQVSRSFLPNEASVSQNLDAKKSQNSMSDLDQRRLEETRNNKNKETASLASITDMTSVASSSDRALQFQVKYRELDFPGVEFEQLVKELREIYGENRELFPNFKESYLDPSNCVFRDFVREFIFILRNTFEIPDDPERMELMMQEVLSAPILYHEYEKLIEEVSNRRFLWGLNDYGGMDMNGDGKITLNEIETKVGKSKKKMTKLINKERTKDDHISLTEFLMCWDNAGKKGAKKGGNDGKSSGGGGRKNKAFKHEKKYDSTYFPGVTIDDIADELREAYANNQNVLECYKEEYTSKDNPLFSDFVQELLFVKRNISNVVPTDEVQFHRLLMKLLEKPIEYSEYCSILSQLPVNKFGWGIEGFAKLDLDANGSISPEEIEAAFGKSKKKREKLEALEKNNDGKISLAEFLHCWEHEPRPRTVPYKVMMVLTNNADLGTTGRKTGFYLPEVAHPYHVFKESGLDVVFVSPRGGHSPMDPGSYEAYMDDLICMNFIEDPKVLHQLDNTLNPANIDPKDISAVFYAGGHGPMWDVAFDKEIAEISRRVYVEFNGILGAVCHGTCGLLPISLKRATKPSLLDGKKVTSFTNQEEEMIFNDAAWDIMNFQLETKLEEKGAKFQRGEPFEVNVVNHKGVITGQNPQSATKCAQIMVEELAAKIADKNAFNKLI